MTSHSEDSAPFEWRIDPNSYRFEDFGTILAHPGLTPETVEPETVITVISALADLGHTALIRGGVDAYRPWGRYATDFVARQPRQNADDFPYHQLLTDLYFQATMQGDIEASQQLRENLTRRDNPLDSALTTLPPLLRACASQGVYPGVWIDLYAASASERAILWADYLTPHESSKTKPINEAELNHGVQGTQQVFLEGQLSPDAAIIWAPHALRFATSAEERQRISARIRRLVPLIKAGDELDGADWVDLLPTIAVINIDPDVPRAEKLALQQESISLLPPWNDTDDIEKRAAFEFSCMIRDGSSPKQIRAHIQTILNAVSDAEAEISDEELGYGEFEERIYGQPLLISEDMLLSIAAGLYAQSRQYGHAAMLIASINVFYSWLPATELYAEKGGDTEHIRNLEKANELFDAARVAMGLESLHLSAEREAVLDYLDAMAQNPPDYQRAFGALAVQFAELPVRTEQLHQLDELLSKDPSLIARRSEMVTNDRTVSASRLRQVFMAHNDPDSAAKEWSELQAVGYGAVWYFIHFAELSLISCGVFKDYS